MPPLSPGLDDDAFEQSLLEALDAAAGKPPRQDLPAGAILLREGEPTDGIWLILSGEVELSRAAGDERVTLSDDVSGRIIGLLALASRQTAFFTCVAATDVRAVKIPWNTLDSILQQNPSLAGQFTQQLVRSLGSRVRHVVELQARVQNLNQQLREERDRIESTLRELAATQTRLVESERLAMLGQLVAGIAHELNNPVTAIRRSADYVLEDVSTLVGELPDNEAILAMITSALTTPPLPTEELRQRRAQLSRDLGDEALADRLVKIGITTRAEYDQWFGRVKRKHRAALLARLETASELGTFLRNLQGAAGRVSQIVGTLRAYARGQQAVIAAIDINKSLEDTLLLLSSKTRSVEIVRNYGNVPAVEGDLGQINQVWTNLIVNAIEAMNGTGRLEIISEVADANHVRVKIIDSGPGISADHLPRLFDINFTTKHGPSSFGLGMGLLICKQVITRHEGRIDVESRPGRTCFSVTLPVTLSPWARRELERSGLAGAIESKVASTSDAGASSK